MHAWVNRTIIGHPINLMKRLVTNLYHSTSMATSQLHLGNTHSAHIRCLNDCNLTLAMLSIQSCSSQAVQALPGWGLVGTWLGPGWGTYSTCTHAAAVLLLGQHWKRRHNTPCALGGELGVSSWCTTSVYCLPRPACFYAC